MNTTELGCRRQEIAQIPDEAGNHRAPCPLVDGRFEPPLAATGRQLAERIDRHNRMRPVMTAWQDMPDAAPDRRTICRRLKHRDNPGPVPATS